MEIIHSYVNPTFNNILNFHDLPQQIANNLGRINRRRSSNLSSILNQWPTSFPHSIWNNYIIHYINRNNIQIKNPSYIEDISTVLCNYNFLYRYRPNRYRSTQSVCEIHYCIILSNVNLIISLYNLIYGQNILNKINYIQLSNSGSVTITINTIHQTCAPSIIKNIKSYTLHIDETIYENIVNFIEDQDNNSLAQVFTRIIELTAFSLLEKERDEPFIKTKRSENYDLLKNKIIAHLINNEITNSLSESIYNLIIHSQTGQSNTLFF